MASVLMRLCVLGSFPDMLLDSTAKCIGRENSLFNHGEKNVFEEKETVMQ